MGFPMSIENLTHGEYYYFKIDSDYRNDVKDWLNELGKKILCVPVDELHPYYQKA